MNVNIENKIDLKEKFKYDSVAKTYLKMKSQFADYLDEIVNIILNGGKKTPRFGEIKFDEYELDVLESIKESILSSNEILKNDYLSQLPQLKVIINKFKDTDNILTYYYIYEDLEYLLKEQLGSNFNEETVKYKLDRMKYYLDKLIDILLPLDSIIIHLDRINETKESSIGTIHLKSGKLKSTLTVTEFVILFMNLPDYLKNKLRTKIAYDFFKNSSIYIGEDLIRTYTSDIFRKAKARKKNAKADPNKLKDFVDYLLNHHPHFK